MLPVTVSSVAHKSWINSASLGPDGRHMITASDDGTAKIHGVKADQSWAQEAIIVHDDVVNSASFSPDGSYV
ncbi:hypothetical protein [Endozoicomonas sp. 2B-B]